MGLPGSGKGTISSLCTSQLGWVPLSTGNLCREHIQKQTDLGKQIDFIIKSGKLVSDEIIAEMVEQWLKQVFNSPMVIVLDGYPRTLRQAHLLDAMLEKLNVNVKMQILHFNINSEKIMERILYRTICTNKECQRAYSLKPNSGLLPQSPGRCDSCNAPLTKRSDDTMESIRHRLDSYHCNEQDIVKYYLDRGIKPCVINTDRAVEVIFEDVKKIAGVHDVR